MKQPVLLTLALFLTASAVAEEITFGPAVGKELIYDETFLGKHTSLPKEVYQPRQGTRWVIADGVLRGIPSSAEYQAKKDHHRGLEPRLSFPVTPAECIARFSIRFLEGEETSIVPFIEFGHHIVRVRFSEKEGVSLLVDYESLKVAEDKSYRYPKGEWIEIHAALKGDEFLIQITDGPTLYAKHPVIPKRAPSGGAGLGLAGPRGGAVEINQLYLWTVQPGIAPSWEKQKKALPVFEPVKVREKPVK